jgi:tetratricopeptide (TPR) repeat protein
MARTRGIPHLSLLVFIFPAAVSLAQGPPQGFGGPQNPLIRQGTQLDLEGKGAEARESFQTAIDNASTPAAKANAERAMAMSWAFESNCGKTVEYENRVIDYWKTQEKDDPSHAFYEEGEMADEAARVCVDSGDLTTALELYKKGHDLGEQEPKISPARKALWDFRLHSAEARISARHNQKAEAQHHLAAAKAALDRMKDADASLYDQQKAFVPYTEGYIAYHTGDYKTALDDLQQANQHDPFVQCLIGMAYEKLGDNTEAIGAYRQAAQTNAHNPPAAFAKPFATKKLANSSSGTQD